MAFSKKQHEYFGNATKRWNIKSGATRSGKTHMDYFVIPKRIRACGDDGLIVIIGNTQATLERNIFDPMRSIWGPSLVGNVRNNNDIYLFGRKCYALGADKSSSVQRLQGAGIQYAYGDEITTWSERMFQMLKSRLDKPNAVFDGTCNPDNPNHWFKEFLESGADIYHQHYTIEDNPFLTPAFVENLKKEYAGTVYYQRYILGQWSRAEGLVYDMFDVDRHVVIKPPARYDKTYIAVDYGTQNPTVFLKIGLSGGAWYVYDEYYYSGRETGRQKTDAAYADDLEAFTGGRKDEREIVDPSAASFIAALRERGRSPMSAKNEVLDGIRKVARAMTEGQIYISANCTNTINEFMSYSWDPKAADRGEDVPIKENDHCMDALRYFVNTIMHGGRLRSVDKVDLGLGRR